MSDLDEEWLSFSNSTISEIQVLENTENKTKTPKTEMPLRDVMVLE